MIFSDKHFRLTRALCFAFAFSQPLAAFKLCLLYSSFWLPSSFACYTVAFGNFQALLAIQQSFAAFQLWLLHSSLWLPSSFDYYTAALIQLDTADVGCLQALLACCACYTAFGCLQAASFGCLQALLVKQQPSTAYTAAFGCLQAFLSIQQPLAAFKICLLNSGLLLPSSFACYTAAFGCLQVLLDTAAVGCLQAMLACFACYTALLNTQQPLAAFKLYLLYSSLWLPSS